MAELALGAVAYWAKRGASGLRLDMTAEIPLALGRRLRQRFRELVPDGVVFGEVVPQHAWRWRQERVIEAATDFPFHEALGTITCNMHASLEDVIAGSLRADLVRGGDARTAAVRLLSSHDHPRLASLAAASGTLQRLPLAYALLATWPGVPMLLYGEELGMRSDGAGRDVEDVWPDRAPRPWAAGHGDGRGNPRLVRLREQSSWHESGQPTRVQNSLRPAAGRMNAGFPPSNRFRTCVVSAVLRHLLPDQPSLRTFQDWADFTHSNFNRA